jgi:hypothetical protein
MTERKTMIVLTASLLEELRTALPIGKTAIVSLIGNKNATILTLHSIAKDATANSGLPIAGRQTTGGELVFIQLKPGEYAMLTSEEFASTSDIALSINM